LSVGFPPTRTVKPVRRPDWDPTDITGAILQEVERDRSDLFIIGHASVIRCLFAYLKGLPPHDIPLVSIRRGQLIEVTPTSYGVQARTHTFWTPADNPVLYKFVSDEDAFNHAPESEQKAEELNKAIAPLAI